MKVLLPALFALFACSCATVVRGTNDSVQFESSPASATATAESIDKERLGPLSCVTPCEMELKRKRTWRVDFTLDGYKTASGLLTPKVTGEGVGAGLGNALIGGLVGVGIDAGTGANLDLKPNPMIAELQPLDSPDDSQVLDAAPVPPEEPAAPEVVPATDEPLSTPGALDAADETAAPAAAEAVIDETAAPPDAVAHEAGGEVAAVPAPDAAIGEAVVPASATGAPTPDETAPHAVIYRPGEPSPTDEESADLNRRQLDRLTGQPE